MALWQNKQTNKKTPVGLCNNNSLYARNFCPCQNSTRPAINGEKRWGWTESDKASAGRPANSTYKLLFKILGVQWLLSGSKREKHDKNSFVDYQACCEPTHLSWTTILQSHAVVQTSYFTFLFFLISYFVKTQTKSFCFWFFFKEREWFDDLKALSVAIKRSQ